MTSENIKMDVTIVGTEDDDRTYEVRRKWETAGKKALVVELYPTIKPSECYKLDLSSMHLINHIREPGWNDVRIVNLYPMVFETKPLTGMLEDDTTNMAYIEEILEDKDIREYDIVVAWGSSLSTHKLTNALKREFLMMIKDKGLSDIVKCITADKLITSNEYGVHPLYLGLQCSREEWKLADYPVDSAIDMIENADKKVDKDTKSEKKGGKKNVSKNNEQA